MMLALIFNGGVKLVSDYPAPRAKRGEALVAVSVAGVCRTDLEISRGYMNFSGVMGHEFVGRVVDGPKAWVDKRVVGEINCICGHCDMCKSGLSNHCRERTVIGIDGRDGALAEFISLPVRNLHKVPDNVDDEQAVFIEPLAAAFQVVRQVKFSRRDEIIVLGDGRLGQLVARVLKGHVNDLLLVGKHADKLIAAEKQGIQTCVATDFVPCKRAAVVVEATGSSSGFELATRTVRPRGTIVLKSTFATESGCNLAPLVVDEVTVVGSRCGPFPEAIRALSKGEVDISALISRRFSLREGLQALKAAQDPRNIKVLIHVQK